MPRLAVLGHPVAHSRSPAMQNAALAALGLGEEWSYEAIDVAPEEFEARVRAMPGEGFAGANVTVPHKEAALALADVPSAIAKGIGAANTLVFDTERVQAHNTDAAGFLGALPASPKDKRALVLGAGGAARAVVWALAREGARVKVWNRTETRARQMQAELSDTFKVQDSLEIEANAAAGTEGSIEVCDDAELDQSGYDLIVNTTTVGLHGEDPFAQLPLAPAGFAAGQTVVDMVYGAAPSPLLAAATSAGATVVGGVEILVRQGALSLRIWTGRDAPLDVMRTAARA